jgi:hypothetical protein
MSASEKGSECRFLKAKMPFGTSKNGGNRVKGHSLICKRLSFTLLFVAFYPPNNHYL